MRLWIDTDVGDNPDDAVALLSAAAHREVELVGVSTSAGDPDRRARAVRALVDAPVVSGEMPDELVGAFRAAAPDATLAIGPLTNIAALLEAGVPVPDLTVMGGVLRRRCVIEGGCGRWSTTSARIPLPRRGSWPRPTACWSPWT